MLTTNFSSRRRGVPAEPIIFDMTHRLVCLLLAGAVAMPTIHALAQTTADDNGPQEQFVFPQKKPVVGIDNYLFNVFYNSGKNAYNLRGLPVAKGGKTIQEIKVNPSGTSVAVLEKDKKGKSTLSVYHLYKSNSKIKELKDYKNATAIAYTPDSKKLAVATPGKVTFLDSRLFNKAGEIAVDTQDGISKLAYSPDGRNLAVVAGNDVMVYDTEMGGLRQLLDFDAAIRDLDFSNANDIIAVLTDDGVMHLYDTCRFLTLGSIDGLGLASSLSFNPDDKYVSVVTGDSRIALVNRLDEGERDFVEDELGGISDARFVKDMKGNQYLAYNTAKNITYKLMSLAPNYTKLLAEELEDKMAEWMKMMPGETLEEYNLRVNDDTRMAQMKLFEQEIATRMADNFVATSQVTLGDYNPQTGMLAISFDNMPPVYLNVPSGDLNDFMNGADLEFRNAKYGLTDNDKFELIYAEVYNKNTGKSYTFDNLARESLTLLQESEDFVPLELIQQTNLQEFALEDVKNNIVNLAMEEGKISDHTHFNVESRVVTDKDIEGEKITNYEIDFSYEVDPGFSAQEDFAPGKYASEGSPAANAMLNVIKTALESDFAQYVKPGKKLKVKITGMADAMPIKGRIAYSGVYGDFEDEPIYKDGNLSAISVSKASGITNNEQLAFLRATGVKEYIAKEVKNIDSMDVDYITEIELADEKGGEYRRIKAEFTFVDAFDN